MTLSPDSGAPGSPPAAGAPQFNGQVPAASLPAAEVEALREAGKAWDAMPTAAGESPLWPISPDLAAIERRSTRPDARYVRIIRSERLGFDRLAPGLLQATPPPGAQTHGFAHVRARARNALIGAPLSTSQFARERLTKVKALAVLSSDALSSVAYATEQILVVLAVAGAAALGVSLGVMVAIVVLLAFVVLSYRQTIRAYPKGGGSYIVAKDNLGPNFGLVAAAALMTDYVLTVAVSVASGVDQIQSAIPAAATQRVGICAGLIAVIMVGNLRGVRESGSIFAAPTYLFIGAMFVMLVTLLVRGLTGSILPASETAAIHGAESLTIFLILRAFASGCTALTGVEAISDGVPAFKPPEWRNARITLSVMGMVLAAMFVGVTVASQHLGLRPFDSLHPQCAAVASGGSCTYQSILAQLATHAFGNGSALFVVVAVATTLILILAANTSFSDFPRLLFFLARDDYAPHQFRRMGDRLAYSNGIVVLGLLAMLLEVVFSANVAALIPLYAVGVFLAFTLSQAGMVVRWLRRREPGWRRGLPLNVIGMCLTGVVFVVFGATKLLEGAWVVILIIPTLVMIFRSINRHYTDVAAHISSEIPARPISVHATFIVPITDLNAIALETLTMARTFSPTVLAVHVCDSEEHIAALRARWEAWGNHVPLTIIDTPYRSYIKPLIAYLDAIGRQRPEDTLVVVVPELVSNRWWHNLLHNQTALRLKATLLFRPRTVVMNVPYHISRVHAGEEDVDAI
ncbi:MAG TPA: APC family permease [Candidatus Dormibacteraeota bacterium]|nr:APC family permease [Candidatus Dormibacteraeota bacterium]